MKPPDTPPERPLCDRIDDAVLQITTPIEAAEETQNQYNERLQAALQAQGISNRATIVDACLQGLQAKGGPPLSTEWVLEAADTTEWADMTFIGDTDTIIPQLEAMALGVQTLAQQMKAEILWENILACQTANNWVIRERIRSLAEGHLPLEYLWEQVMLKHESSDTQDPGFSKTQTKLNADLTLAQTPSVDWTAVSQNLQDILSILNPTDGTEDFVGTRAAVRQLVLKQKTTTP